jgi:hypothetical protein
MHPYIKYRPFIYAVKSKSLDVPFILIEFDLIKTDEDDIIFEDMRSVVKDGEK